jgi:hypothetical protein
LTGRYESLTIFILGWSIGAVVAILFVLDALALAAEENAFCSRKYGTRKARTGIERELRALSVMLRFLLVVLLILIGLPAEAQQGRNDYPAIIPHDWTLLPPKSNEWRAVSPRKDAWLSLYATPVEGPVSSH